jgi:hypothetical protein
VDPETRQVRQATPAEIGAATGAGAVRRLAAPPASQVHLGPGGTVGIRLNGSMTVYSVLTKGPDGKLNMECVTGEKAATERVGGSKASQKGQNEE